MITKSMIKAGYTANIIKLIKSPHGDGIACQIGDNWFYFGGLTAEEYKSVKKYKEDIPEDEIVNEIHEALNDFFKDKETFEDEYLYYEYYLKEHGIN